MILSSKQPVVFCFAGQGSQYYHMGSQLFYDHPVFRRWMLAGDEILRNTQGVSIVEAVYDPARRRSEPFDDLVLSNPAIFLVQYALAQTLMHHGVLPDACFGISLGEFISMTLTGMSEFKPTLVSIAKIPGHYQRTCPPGGMIAVLGPATLYETLSGLAATADRAGVNAANHFVLSAPEGGLSRIEQTLAAADIATHRLAVRYAFHSRWIAPAENAVREAFASGNTSPDWTTWSCCAAAPVLVATSELAWKIVRQPMQVQTTINAVEAAHQGGVTWVDCSPSGTVAAILRLALPPGSASRIVATLSPFGEDTRTLQRTVDMLLA